MGSYIAVDVDSNSDQVSFLIKYYVVCYCVQVLKE